MVSLIPGNIFCEESMAYDWGQIFAQGESDRLEFKRSLSGEKEIIETIGAFLNHKGGMIIVGND
ncbi:MAG: ATP-binding protein [Acidobacteria bacterium]|jgi:predicted HTH transcriptional regulator|nr:ATP-binding protein [Acidobacteriota bacterium]